MLSSRSDKEMEEDQFKVSLLVYWIHEKIKNRERDDREQTNLKD